MIIWKMTVIMIDFKNTYVSYHKHHPYSFNISYFELSFYLPDFDVEGWREGHFPMLFVHTSTYHNFFMSWHHLKFNFSNSVVRFFYYKSQFIYFSFINHNFKLFQRDWLDSKGYKSISTFFIEKFPWNPHISFLILFFFVLAGILKKYFLEKLRMLTSFGGLNINKMAWITANSKIDWHAVGNRMRISS